LKPSLASLFGDAIQAEAFFCGEEQVNRLPYVHSFPKSSCELASAFLAVAIEDKYYDSLIRVAKAYCRSNNEWHFWIEVGDLVLDATAHQFTEYKNPLVCLRPSPLEARFTDIERLAPKAALSNLNALSEILKESVVTTLVQELTSKTTTVSESHPSNSENQKIVPWPQASDAANALGLN
jgi:hypothetical protein